MKIAILTEDECPYAKYYGRSYVAQTLKENGYNSNLLIGKESFKEKLRKCREEQVNLILVVNRKDSVFQTVRIVSEKSKSLVTVELAKLIEKMGGS